MCFNGDYSSMHNEMQGRVTLAPTDLLLLLMAVR